MTKFSKDDVSHTHPLQMPVGDDPFDPDALLFRAPSVPPPLSVGSNCSSVSGVVSGAPGAACKATFPNSHHTSLQKYETAATDADDTKSTIDGEEEKMDEEVR